VHAAYSQLARFEDYPRFMEEVEAVQRIDDTHVHWKTIMSNRPVEWDAEITEQEPDRCIAWHNVSGPTNAGKIELQPMGPDTSRVTLTLHSEPEQVPGSPAGNDEEAMTRKIRQDLARLKDFIETRGSGSGAGKDMAQGAQAESQGSQTAGDSIGKAVGRTAQEQQDAASAAQPDHGPPGAASVAASTYAAGSEGWAGNEDPAEPVTSSTRNATQQNSASEPPQAAPTTQSPSSLSRSLDERATGGRFSVAEEVSLDEQSDDARRVGQMPPELNAAGAVGANPSEAMAQSLEPAGRNARDEEKLKQSLDRAVPPSE
jgi:hypothetical protein